ncbi:beta-ketoacyl-ACP synthase III [Actinokineospora enzanensis]|uniref:beta-ketoacyl-ACP synthase III n=1 Tax=Actinokineospora enzanensis TaxID=155975 RepID=UPI00039BF158|nr:beta-ketoacyl-ACP synthase III [Actinokineospora enzanensis]
MRGHLGVLATGSYVPDRVVTNEELAHPLDIGPEWVMERTGVHERRRAAPDEATSDLATRAADRALAAAGVRAAEVDLIIVATSTPDLPLPATACQVQANLGVTGGCAMDLDAVCTGFVYALDVAHKMMRCDPAVRHALVIGADTYSRILDYRDRRTCVLFGDGAGAVVLGRSEHAARIDHTRLGSDGTKNDYVHIPSGGSRAPASAAAVAAGDHFFKMNGRLVREFVGERLPAMVAEALADRDLTVSDIDLFVPHQANARVLADVCKEIGFLPEQLAVTVDRFGNTGAASIPITLDHAVAAGRPRPGGRILLAGFGGGMTWGTALLTWGGNPS